MNHSLTTRPHPVDAGASRVEYSLLMAAVAALVVAIVLAVLGLAHTAADQCARGGFKVNSSQCS